MSPSARTRLGRFGTTAACTVPRRATFRLPIQRGQRWYSLVCIAPTLGEMRRLMRHHHGWGHPRQYGAVVSVAGWTRRTHRRTGLMGVIDLSSRAFGAGIVAHELSHAAFRVLERRRLQARHWEPTRCRQDGSSRTHTGEEAYCNIVEDLSREFWRLAYRHGVVS